MKWLILPMLQYKPSANTNIKILNLGMNSLRWKTMVILEQSLVTGKLMDPEKTTLH